MGCKIVVDRKESNEFDIEYTRELSLQSNAGVDMQAVLDFKGESRAQDPCVNLVIAASRKQSMPR
jgi:hypothetical protein